MTVRRGMRLVANARCAVCARVWGVPLVWFEPGERPCPEKKCTGRLTLVPW